jgi:hypothetical protein
MVRAALYLSLGLAAGLAAGCGVRYSSVTGRVTFDGKPLQGATVGFYPAQGRGSHGLTDADGRYELVYTNTKAGVPPGRCVVRITTADVNTPEKLPARYHEKTELAEDVQPGGNVFDFALKAK